MVGTAEYHGGCPACQGWGLGIGLGLGLGLGSGSVSGRGPHRGIVRPRAQPSTKCLPP